MIRLYCKSGSSRIHINDKVFDTTRDAIETAIDYNTFICSLKGIRSIEEWRSNVKNEEVHKYYVECGLFHYDCEPIMYKEKK